MSENPTLSGDWAETAFAKINLALHVRAKDSDGYHRIETLFAFAEDGDLLTVEPGDTLSLTVTGPCADALAGEGDNLVLRAARALREAFNVAQGAALRLDKHLPVASGIGGGSADAAATLRLLSRFWGLETDPTKLDAIARALGADVPACLRSEPARGEGRGDRLEPIASAALSGMPLLLVNPRMAVSTAAVFSGWDGIDRGALKTDDPIVAALAGRNDLESPARGIAPAITDVVDALAGSDGVVLARMSGSGATCFALFEDIAARDAADDVIGRAHSGWWRLKTRLRTQLTVPQWDI